MGGQRSSSTGWASTPAATGRSPGRSRGAGHRRLRLRPPRLRRVGGHPGLRGPLGQSPRRPCGADARTSGRRAPGLPARPVRPLDGRPDRRRLRALRTRPCRCRTCSCSRRRPSTPSCPAGRSPLAGVLTGVVAEDEARERRSQRTACRGTRRSRRRWTRIRCASSTSTVRFGAEAFAEQDRVQAVIAGISRCRCPTYVLHGSADPIVPPAASAILEGKGNVTRRVHAGLRHECHHEPEHAAGPRARSCAWIRANVCVGVAGGRGPGSPGADPGRQSRPRRCRLPAQPNIRLRGAPRALRVWFDHRPAEPDPVRTGVGSRPARVDAVPGPRGRRSPLSLEVPTRS